MLFSFLITTCIIIIVIKTIKPLWEYIYFNYICKGKDLAETYGKGTYAIITGGTSGMGLDYAHYLAALGFNLVLISKNPERIMNGDNSFQRAHPDTKIINIHVDFTKEDSIAFYEKLFDQIPCEEVSMLINAVGTYTGGRQGSQLEMIRNSIAVTMMPVMMMSKMFIDKVKPTQKNRKAIINVSYEKHLIEDSEDTTFTALKNAVWNLSVGENMAWNDKGMDILCVAPSKKDFDCSSQKENDTVELNAKLIVKKSFKAIGNIEMIYGSEEDNQLPAFFQVVKEYTSFLLPIILPINDYFSKKQAITVEPIKKTK